MVKILFVALLVLIIISLEITSEVAFKKTFLKNKKNKGEALNSLFKRGMLDNEIYNEVEIEEIYIKSKENFKIKGYLIEEYKKSNRYVILIHGYSDNHHSQMPFIRMFLKEGFNILLVDERNHGDSEGKYPSYGYYEKEDINRFIDFLTDRVGNDILLGLHGQSMGAATSLMCAARNQKVDFVIEDCGYSSAKEVVKFQIGRVKFVPKNLTYLILKFKARIRAKIKFEEIMPIDDICNCREDLPILFIHGKKDRKVPYQMCMEMYKKRNNINDSILLVDDADHMVCYNAKKKEYERMVHELISKTETIKINKEQGGLQDIKHVI